MGADTITLPKPPPGFVLDNPPEPPKGFVLDIAPEPPEGFVLDEPQMVDMAEQFLRPESDSLIAPELTRPKRNRPPYGYAPGMELDLEGFGKSREDPIEVSGLPEIGKAIKEMVSPTTTYTKEESDAMAGELYDRFKWWLTYGATLGGRIGPEGLKDELLEQAENFKGFGPALMPSAGKTGSLALEWGVIYPALFKAAGLTGTAISGIPQVQKGAAALAKIGGISKLAEKYPKAAQVISNMTKAFGKGAAAGATVGTAETVGKDMTMPEIIRHVGSDAAIVGTVAATFQAASEIDTALWVKSFRNTLLKSHAARFDARVAQVDAMPNGPAKTAAIKSVGSQKIAELQKIDQVVSAAQAQLMGIKQGMYQRGQEMVESPIEAGNRIAKYGLEAGKVYPAGPKALQKGMGKSKPFIEMPTTRAGEVRETVGEAIKTMRHPVKAVRKATMPTKPPTYAQPPAGEVAPPPLIGRQGAEISKDLPIAEQVKEPVDLTKTLSPEGKARYEAMKAEKAPPPKAPPAVTAQKAAPSKPGTPSEPTVTPGVVRKDLSKKKKFLKSDYPVAISKEGKEQTIYGYAVDMRFNKAGNKISGTGWEWYALEPIKGDVAFGFVHGAEDEYGSFSLSELKELGIHFTTDPKELHGIQPPVGWTKKEVEKTLEPKPKFKSRKAKLAITREGVIATPTEETVNNDLIDSVFNHLSEGKSLDAKTFFEMADKAYGGTRAEGTYGPSDAYDVLETAVNKVLLNTSDPSADLEGAKLDIEVVEQYLNQLPSQTNRSGEKDLMQQFSTPPHYAYVVAWAANIGADDVVLEPSAGTGSLVVHAVNAEPKSVFANELSERRAKLLENLGVDKVFTEDAEQIHNILPEENRPSVILMNPPFSHAAHRMGDKKIYGTDLKHIDAALAYLQDNGRLVAIMGRPLHAEKGESRAFDQWIEQQKSKYNVKANVYVGRKIYKKYGTQFPTRVLVIDKTGPTTGKIVGGEVDSISDLMYNLEGVRNERVKAKQESVGKPVREGAEAEKTAAGPKQPIQPATTSVGTGKQRPDRPLERRPAETPRPSKPDVRLGTEGGTKTPSERPRSVGEQPAPARSVSGREPSQQTVREQQPKTKTIAVTTHEQKRRIKEQTAAENVFEPYHPSKFSIANSKPHPASLVESTAMAAVLSPDIKYELALPKKVIEKGILSDIQLEAIAYAGQAHEHMLPGGKYRKGYFIGDGTGVGKGRTVCGIILDNINKGRKKAIWFSANAKLYEDSKVYWKVVGEDKVALFNLSKVKVGTTIAPKSGIMYSTYDTLRSQGKLSEKAKAGAKGAKAKTRLEQVVEWFGEDYDGVIVFDESHKMANAMAERGTRGVKKPSKRAIAGIELQNKLPNARVVYVSATGATEVSNLAYAKRLGLWGEETAFPKASSFISEMTSGGIANMELVARDMKALGLYTARQISFNDGTEKGTVNYDRIEHKLTVDQIAIYNKLVEGWHITLQNMEAALKMINGDKSKDAKGAAKSAYWGAHQRFFNQIITSMQTPSVVNAIEKDLKEGHSVLIQLTNTNEASQERALAKLGKEQTLEDFDTTPRDMLMQLIEHSFPTTQYEVYTDENGNEKSRPVKDSRGNFVKNKEAVRKREKLLDEIGSIQVPDSPLDMIINHFGANKVSEVTGRKRRVILKRQEDGTRKRVIDKRGKHTNQAEIDAYMNGKKRILIFSEAGGTGASYHADNDKKNRQQRIHYLLQPGWRADMAIQGLGRSHRTNQAHAPTYKLVTTNLKGQKRFISSIARRLSQLGALTRGERKAGESGLFTASDNLESHEAHDALRILFHDIASGRADIDLATFQEQTGLQLIDKNGNLKMNLPPIHQFLNRLLSLTVDFQNQVFDAYHERLISRVEQAIANGTLDQGMETYRADKIEKISDKVVYVHPQTKNKTEYVKLKISRKTHPLSWSKVQERHPLKYVQSKRGSKIYAVNEAHSKTDARTGKIISQYRLTSPSGLSHYVEQTHVDWYQNDWMKLKAEEAGAIWNKEYQNLPEYNTKTEHFLTGLILPIWDKIRGKAKIYRIITNDGEELIGRIIHANEVETTLKALGATTEKQQIGPENARANILAGNIEVELANKWIVKYSRVQSEDRIEIKGPSFLHEDELKKHGVFKERIQSKTRYFIPTKEVSSFTNVVNRWPIVEVNYLSGGEVIEEEATQKRIISQDAYEAAKKRLTDKNTLRSGVDPQGFADLITVGAYHFESGVRTFAAWSKKMIKEFGPAVKPYLKNIWSEIGPRKAMKGKPGFVDLTPIAEAGKQLEKPLGKARDMITRFTDVEPEVRKVLIEYEEQLRELPKAIAKESVDKFGSLTEKQERAIENHREEPVKYPTLDDSLKPFLAMYEMDINKSGEIMEELGYPADWVNRYRERLQKSLDKEESRSEPDLEKIDGLKEAIKEAEGLRYLHHYYKKQKLPKRISNFFRRRISKKPKGLLGRKIPTYKKAEALGLERAPLAVTRAHMMYSAQRAQAANELIMAVNNNPNLSQPEEKAPEGWVYLDENMWPASVQHQAWVTEEGKPAHARKRRKYAPPIARSLEELTYARTPNQLVRWYDNANHTLKIIGFYNPLVMSKNDMVQGWRAAGVKHSISLPKAIKIFAEKGETYHRLRKGGLFNNVVSYVPAIDVVTNDLLAKVRQSFGERVARKAAKWLNPLRIHKTLQEFNEKTTWNLDEIMRIACYEAIKGQSTTKGMSDFEIIELANDFMANYGKLPRGTKGALTKIFFVPTYRISNLRVFFGRMMRSPWRYKGPILRTIGWKMFVYFGLPALAGAAIKWWTKKKRDNIRTERGYRLVIPNPKTGKDTVYALSDPLLEGAKLTQRPIRHSLEVNLAPLPSLLNRVLRGPKWKYQEDAYGEFFKLGTPIYRDILNWKDPDKTIPQKIMSQFAVAYTYTRSQREPDKVTAGKALAKALSIWTDWKMQKMDVDRMMGKPVDLSSLFDARESIDWALTRSAEPRKLVDKYNKRAKKIIAGLPKDKAEKYNDRLIIDIEDLLQKKAIYLGQRTRTPEEIKRAQKFMANFGITPEQAVKYQKAGWDKQFAANLDSRIANRTNLDLDKILEEKSPELRKMSQTARLRERMNKVK